MLYTIRRFLYGICPSLSVLIPPDGGIVNHYTEHGEDDHTDGDEYSCGNGKTLVIDARIPSPYGVVEDLGWIGPHPTVAHFVGKFG